MNRMTFVAILALGECCCTDTLSTPGPVEAADPVPKKVTRRICLLENGDLGRYWYTWVHKVQKRGEDPDKVFTAEGSRSGYRGRTRGASRPGTPTATTGSRSSSAMWTATSS